MRNWKESASLIVAARQGQKNIRNLPPKAFQYNYQLLCLKRHQNSKFMPGTYVFPGGELEPADADLKWQKLFSGFGLDKDNFSALFPKTATARTGIFREISNELPREISLRISAIRETFEECGLLLCKSSRDTQAPSDWAQHLHGSELQTWQSKVHADASEFYTLCDSLKCYPDLWSLHEWSNWMTPTSVPGRRYDTIFYLACMQSMPNVSYEATEMEALKWDTPRNLLNTSTEILLAPPQHYEFARLAKFESIDNLLEFAVERSKMGVLLNLPVKIELKDGNAFVLPGDSMYPKDLNLSEKQVIDKSDLTVGEFRNISPVQHRLEFYNVEVKKLHVHNYEAKDGHLTPIESETMRMKPKNKSKL